MKTVMLFGTFDIIHDGDFSLLRQASKLGDRLVVVIARDKTVLRIKKHLPLHSESERLQLLSHLDLIDDVMLGDVKDAYRVVRTEKPDIIALGYDQTIFVAELQETLTRTGLDTDIIRLKPYRPKRYKTHRLKDYLIKQL